MAKILALSDEVVERLYNVYARETHPGVNLLLGCGDLPYEYLEFLVSTFNVPLFYVPGNHDPQHSAKELAHVEGGTNLDGRVVFSRGLLMAGFGGSIMYHPGAPNQYSQQGALLRALRLLPKILFHSARHQRALDILISHSPPYGIHDDTDPAHTGLRALNLLVHAAKPRYLLHGHTIFYRHNLNSHITRVEDTQVVNIYPFRVMDIHP